MSTDFSLDNNVPSAILTRMKTTRHPRTRQYNVRCSEDVRWLLAELARTLGVAQATIFHLAIRAYARQQVPPLVVPRRAKHGHPSAE